MSVRAVPLRPILIVDDEPDIVASLTHKLQSSGFSNVVGCQDGREVMDLVRAREPEVILLDLSMPQISGQALLGQLQEAFPYIPVIVVTGSNDVETAVQCMSGGAFDYVVKVGEDARLLAGIRRALDRRRLEESYRQLKDKLLTASLADPAAFAGMVGADRAMQAVFLLVESVAGSDEPILLTGESGTGKTLLARAIHKASGRPGKYVEVNAAGLDDEMFADTLFGHLKGAWTGTVDKREGLIQQAAGGTLLLDEIGDLSPLSQTKLLQLFDTWEYYPLGSDLARRAEARFIVATNHDLERLLAEGRFRRDLYYRLLTHAVRIPPLRERTDDLPVLLEHFLQSEAARSGGGAPRVPPELLQLLSAYDFPGNVRELERMVRHALAGRPSPVLPVAPFREWISRAGPPSAAAPAPAAHGPAGPAGAEALVTFGPRLPSPQQARDLLYEEALRRAQGNQSAAAGLLGISHQALSKWVGARGGTLATGGATSSDSRSRP